MHNIDKTQIWLSTYNYPKNANSTYALNFEYDRIFKETEEIKIVGISSDWPTSPYAVYVYYTLTNKNGRGKLMYTLMDTSKKVTTYYFTPDYGMVQGFLQI